MREGHDRLQQGQCVSDVSSPTNCAMFINMCDILLVRMGTVRKRQYGMSVRRNLEQTDVESKASPRPHPSGVATGRLPATRPPWAA
jgi:hypothetical protein